MGSCHLVLQDHRESQMWGRRVVTTLRRVNVTPSVVGVTLNDRTSPPRHGEFTRPGLFFNFWSEFSTVSGVLRTDPLLVSRESWYPYPIHPFPSTSAPILSVSVQYSAKTSQNPSKRSLELNPGFLPNLSQPSFLSGNLVSLITRPDPSWVPVRSRPCPRSFLLSRTT